MEQESRQQFQPDTQEIEQEITRLWDTFAETGSLEAKNSLTLHYLHIVKRIVTRMMPTHDVYNDYDDMVSCGVLGLMDAIDKYDMSRDVKFEYYASKRVHGEIIDHMRKQDWAPSSLRRKIKKVNAAFSNLESELHRQPTEDEVAAHLGMSIRELQKVLEQSHTFNIIHFEEFLNDNYNSLDLKISDDDAPSARLESKEMTVILGEIIESLPHNEKTIVSLHYYEEMTLKQIAAILGISESRVSQIHSKVLVKLKNKLEAAFEV